MSAPICYIINKEIDGAIAAKFGWTPQMGNKGMNPAKIASLRGLYDQQAIENGTEPLLPMDNPSEEDLDKAAKALMNFRTAIKASHQAKIAKGIKRMDRCYDALRHAYSLHQRQSRINLISNLFSAEVDRLMEGSQVNRQSYVNGFITFSGEHVGGEFSILEGVYNNILEIRANYYRASLDPQTYFNKAKEANLLEYADAPKTAEEYQKMAAYRYEEYTKVLENWDQLIPFVLKDLVKKEGVKLGIKREFAAAASSDNFGDNDIASKWDISESKRDGWMENSDMQSAFGSVGQQVRRILATVPMVEQVPMFETTTDPQTGLPYKKVVGTKLVPVLDDLGNQQFMDPIKTHQQLQELLKGIQNSEDMLYRLSKKGKPGEAKVPWMKPLLDILVLNPQARTQFFCDFKRNFQPYSIMFDDNAEGDSFFRKIKTKVLNKAKNYLKGKYDLTLSSKGKLPINAKIWGHETVFDENTKEVNWKRLAELRQKVLLWTTEEKTQGNGVFDQLNTYGVSTAPLINNGRNATIMVDGKPVRLTYEMKREFLMEVFSALGYDVTVDAVDSILQSSDIYAVRDQLEQLFDPKGLTGIVYRMIGDEPSLFKTLTARNKSKEEKEQALQKLQNKHIRFKSFYMRPSANGRPIQEHSEKLLDIISKHQEVYRVESRVRYNGNTLYSFVSPSYLGDRLETIQSYVENDNKIGLLQFLRNEYLCSPFFVDDEYLATNGASGRILNSWLSDLVAACKDRNTPLMESVAAIFSYERDLGREDKKFEDFTAKEHGLDMFVHFFADEQQQKGYGGKGTKDIRKKLSAMYPVFILGDAGVSKYIRAPRISSAVRVDKNGNVLDEADASKTHHIEYVFDNEAQEKVLDAFWDIYLQENRRMAMDEAMAYEMYANGKKVEHAKGEFSFLTFLNSEEYAIPQGKEYDAQTVKAIIRQYLEDASIGSEELKNKGRKSFKQRMEDLGILETGDTRNGKVYRNISSIATPDNIDSKVREFYWNTKLATVQQLQLMTIDPSFYLGTKDLQKRYKEIHAPGTSLDVKAVDFDGNLYCPERTTIINGKVHTIPAGTETVVYFEDINVNAEETNPEFMKMIELNFGKDSEVYKAYTKNTLTDGQGYRTLESYRRVMGMAGKWLTEHEEAYKAIMQIRKNHLADNSEPTPEELKRVAQFALVLQPIKPYMFTHEKYPIQIAKRGAQWNIVIGTDGKPVMINTYKLIPVQHKYAEALIIPELLPKGSKLRDLGLWMDAHQVDMVGSTKIAKVGCFGQANISNISDLSVKAEKAKSKLPDSAKTDDSPVRLLSFEHHLDFNVFVGKTYNVKLDNRIAQYHILGYEQEDGHLPTDVWIVSSEDPSNVYKLAVSTVAQWIDAAGSHSPIEPKELLESAMNKAYIHELPYQDYRIQTNVPEHINSSQLFGTQVRKLIMAGIDMGDDYSSYIGRSRINLSASTDENDPNRSAPVTGRNILALYNSLICANIMESYEKFAQNAGDIEALSELLMQSTIGSMREAMDNLLSYVVTGSEKDLQKFMIPLFEGGLEHDTAALILSTFKKIVNKQQISGGSAVQVSAFGIDGYKEDGGLRYVSDPDNPANILYAEIEMPFDKSFIVDVKDANGNISKQKVNLPYDKYCFQNGYMIPTGEALQKGTPEWKKYQSYTYKEVDGKLVPCDYDDPEAKVYKPLIEEDYPDILSILAYRIPTERAYSMINCQIKRFSNKMAGGTLKVPAQGTTIAGFDFDIDKLYFMQREYHKHFNEKFYSESNFSESDKWEIWTAFYEENPEIKEALEAAREEAEANNPDLVSYKPIVRNGVDTGRVRKVHKTPLNAYWDAANIEQGFGKNKNTAFAETAQAEGIKPTQNISSEQTEWMESYDFDKSPEENTRASRNNLLITLIQARLMDPQTIKQRYTPGGFENASKAARLMRELMYGDLTEAYDGTNVDLSVLEQRKGSATDPEPNYDPTDPYTILVYNQQNQVAGKLIGIFANQNTNHAFASAMDVFELNEPIAFCGKSLKDLLHKDNLEDAAQVDLCMSEFLAASVDAVKDPVLNFLNLNTLTADAGALLARLGYNTKEIGLLFNQPVIRKACEEAFNRGVNISTAIDDIAKELIKAGSSPAQNSNITEADLAKAIVEERLMQEKGKTQDDFLHENAKMQMQVLQLFSNILKATQDVSDFVLNTKFTASNAVSSTFGGMYAQQEKVKRYVDKFPKGEKDKGSLSYKMVVAKGAQETGMFSMPIDNDESYMGMSKKEYLRKVRFNPFAYEQAMYDTNRKALKLLAKYFPYERPMYQEMRTRMQELAKYGSLSEDEINSIHSNILVALLAKQEKSLFNGEARHENTDMTNREYYREKFAYDLSEMLAADPDGLGSLAIFKYLYPSSEEIVVDTDANIGLPITKEIWKISMQDVGGLDADTKEEIRESWAYLMQAKDDGYFDSVDYANLGRDLFMYCFYQLGFDFSPYSFMHLAPTAVKDSIIVERKGSLSLKSWDSIKPNSDDVYVWSPSTIGGAEKASDSFGANLGYVGELSGNSFQMPDQLTPNDVRDLIHEAKSHPELKFKIDRELTQEEFNLFTNSTLLEDVPSNIYFSANTLNQVSDESKEAVSYGRSRTYRQLLNEILDGTEQGLNSDEFAQMWILNHIDDARFVLDIDRGNKRLNQIITENISQEGNTQMDGLNYRDRITIDISKYQNKQDMDALSSLVSVEAQDHKIVKSTWSPCIKIRGAYYLAESGFDRFNENVDLKIVYRKVEPWGCSKTVEYDRNKKLTPQMRYQTSVYAEPEVHRQESSTPAATGVTPSNNPSEVMATPSPIEPSNSSKPNLSALRQMAEEYIFNEMVKAIEAKNGSMAAEDKQAMRAAISNSSDQDLNDTVEELKKACRENGVIMLDADGNPMMGC